MGYKLEVENSTQAHGHFQSIADCIDVCIKAHGSKFEGVTGEPRQYVRALEHLTCEHYIRDSQWFGGISSTEIKALFDNRVPLSEKIAKKVHDGVTSFKMSDIAPVDTFEIYHDESGMMLDSTAYFNGEENCMINYDQVQSVRPIVWLACSISAGACESEDYFVNRGIALIRAVHGLERAGVSVGLLAYISGRDSQNGEVAINTIIVKQPQNSLDETTLINCFCSAAFFRHYGIFLLKIQITDKGCGVVTTPTVKDLSGSYAQGQKMVLIPHQGSFNSLESATNTITANIKEQAEILI